MEKLSNPDAFNYEVGVILAAVYSCFPKPCNLPFDPDNEFYPTQLGQTRAEIQFETIKWLVDEGYLTTLGGFVGGQWTYMSLSAAGRDLMQTKTNKGETLGKFLMDIAKDCTREGVKVMIEAVIRTTITG